MDARLKKCTRALRKLNCDVLLVSDPVNIAYLTGFNSSFGYLLITAIEELVYFTDFLYQNEAKKINGWELIINKMGESIFNLIAGKIKKLKPKRVGFEAEKLPFLEYKTINEILTKAKIDFLETKGIIEKIRAVKEQSEIELIKKSIQISQEAFEFSEEIFDERMSEKDLSIEIERFIRLKGDNECAFNTIVAAGKNTVFPHHSPEGSPIGRKFFLIDLGSKYCGYCADLTRIFFWGKMPFLFKKIYDTVRKVQELSINNIKEGQKAADIDKAAREFISKKGWGKYFGHGLGHGIGLSVHELPVLVPNNQEVLKEGMVLTIEPAVYFKDQFGIRVEDMVLVKQKKGEVLSGNIYR